MAAERGARRLPGTSSLRLCCLLLLLPLLLGRPPSAAAARSGSPPQSAEYYKLVADASVKEKLSTGVGMGII